MKFLVLHQHQEGPWVAVWNGLDELVVYLAAIAQYGSPCSVWVGEIGGKWVRYGEWFRDVKSAAGV